MSATDKKKMRRFRLRKDAGPHYEPNVDFDTDKPETASNLRGTEYTAGETLQSDRPLDKLFANKFVPLDRDEGGSASTGGEDFDPDDDPDKDRPVRNIRDAEYNREDRHLTDEELEGKPELKKLNKGRKTREMEVSDKLGDDVTNEFPGAHEADFRIFNKGGKFSIADGDEPGKPLKKGLSKDAAKKALKKLME